MTQSTQSSPCNLCVTKPTGNTLTTSGSAKVVVTGALAVESNASPAIAASGSSKISATGTIRLAGSVTKTGSATVTGNPITPAVLPPIGTDPYTGRAPVPPMATPNTSVADFNSQNGTSLPARTDLSYRNVTIGGSGNVVLPDGYRYQDITISGSVNVTLKPGYYRSLTSNGSGKLSMTPGRYVFTGNVTIGGSVKVTGDSIDLVLTCADATGNNTAACTGTGGSLSIKGSSTVTLTGRTTNLPSITFTPGNKSPLGVEGSAKLSMPSSGLDAPATPISITGSSSMSAGGPVLVGTIALTGSAIINS